MKSKTLSRRSRTLSLAMMALLLPSLTACRTTPREMDDEARRRMLALLMPSRIEIVEPFTRVRSFDDDHVPDGIEVLLQAVNSLDNPGLMIVGDVRIELFSHVPATAQPKGQQLQIWNVRLETADQQRTYWNQITQMYEFKLGLETEKIPSQDKYVLAVTYNSPLGEHLDDETIITRREVTGPLGSPGASR